MHFEMPPFFDSQDDDDIEDHAFAMDKDQDPGQAMWDLVLEAAVARDVLLHEPVRSGTKKRSRPPKLQRALVHKAAHVVFEARFGTDAERRCAAHAFVEEVANQPILVATYVASVLQGVIHKKGIVGTREST